MINSQPDTAVPLPEEPALDAIVQTGARGAVLLASLSTAIVVGLWFAFYLLVFSPRAAP